MAKWQRFGDGTWVNVDQVEVVRVEEDEDGGWQLTAAFASGTTHALSRAEDRDLLVDCTDVLLRDEVGEHLRALADTPDALDTPDVVDIRDEPAAAIVLASLSKMTGNSAQKDGEATRPAGAATPGTATATPTPTLTAARRGWRFWRPASQDGPAMDHAGAPGQPDGVQLRPVG